MAGAALKLALLYVIIMYVDQSLLSWQCLTRPIVIAPLAGLVVGDFHTGIVMGASLEAAFMGISAIGGAVAADATVASIIAVAYAVLTNAGIEEGIAISVPIGTLMASISAMFTPLWAGFAAFFEKLAAECNPKKFLITNLLIGFVQLSINATILFLAVAFGIDGLQNFLGSMPAWVMTGLGAASGMMLAVG
ncbi:MAG: PTS sugar transporter subunit IIC, partial [Erysipelotrichaceae bacterium]|nr:PTS sugar transporter subunit IIC [Erysipelotrichaceae bacterium]